MLYVYARTARSAGAWAREQGVRPRDFRAVGAYCRCVDGRRFAAGDRIVVLGQIDARLHHVLLRNHRKSREAPPVEYLTVEERPPRGDAGRGSAKR